MQKALIVSLFVITTGCTTHKAIVPSLEGKPLVKINPQIPESGINETEED